MCVRAHVHMCVCVWIKCFLEVEILFKVQIVITPVRMNSISYERHSIDCSGLLRFELVHFMILLSSESVSGPHLYVGIVTPVLCGFCEEQR